MTNFEVSDWVQGKTQDGGYIHGFIESMDTLQDLLKVHVVQSDNEESVGKTAVVRGQWIRKQPDISFDDAAAIRNLIDAALITRDEAWFGELSGRLAGATSDAGPEICDYQENVYPNRLRLYDIK